MINRLGSGSIYYIAIIGLLLTNMGLIQVSAKAGEYEQYGDFTYTKNGTSVTVVYYRGKIDSVAVIPDKIDDLPVTAIGNGVSSFSGEFGNMTGVVIPKSVTSISSKAFQSSHKLASVTIPASVTSIGDYAFDFCRGLKEIKVDKGNPAYCSQDGVLFNKSKTTLIQNPMVKTGTYAIPKGVKIIGDGAFACSNLTSISIPNGVTDIGNHAFSRSRNLVNIAIPKGVISIGKNAFRQCDKIKSIMIPSSVAQMGEYAFELCNDMKEIKVDGDNTTYCSDNGVLFNKNKTTLIQYPGNKIGNYAIPEGVTIIGNGAFSTSLYDSDPYYRKITSITIPESVAIIGDFAFYGCAGLTSVEIPGSVTEIGALAFSHCSDLKSISIPENVTYIERGTFSCCRSLTSITIPARVEGIGIGVFRGCDSLTSVMIGSGVKGIGILALNSCKSLKSITVDTQNSTYSSMDGVLFNKDKTKLIKYPESKGGIYTIPDSVTNIEQYAFSSSSCVTGITIGKGILRIEDGAFSGCSSLTSVTIPDNVTSIGPSAFRYCTSLTGIEIPKSVASIGNDAFVGCDSLTGVYFHGNAPVDTFLFSDAKKVTVYYLPGTTGWEPTYSERPTEIWNPEGK